MMIATGILIDIYISRNLKPGYIRGSDIPSEYESVYRGTVQTINGYVPNISLLNIGDISKVVDGSLHRQNIHALLILEKCSSDVLLRSILHLRNAVRAAGFSLNTHVYCIPKPDGGVRPLTIPSSGLWLIWKAAYAIHLKPLTRSIIGLYKNIDPAGYVGITWRSFFYQMLSTHSYAFDVRACFDTISQKRVFNLSKAVQL